MRNLADVVVFKALILLKLLAYGTSEYWPSTIVQFALPKGDRVWGRQAELPSYSSRT